MKPDSAHSSNWATGEVVFGIPFLVAIGLQYMFPFYWPRETERYVLLIFGITFIVTGTGLIIASRKQFRRFGQPTDPGRPTTGIIKSGVFSISRNPLYLGSVVFLVGIGLVANYLWVLIAVFVSIPACHYLLVIPEENYLTEKFSEEYIEYKKGVRRWFGRTAQQ